MLSSMLYYKLVDKWLPFKGSEGYWEARYNKGGTSGDGSYRELADFKAEVINTFVQVRDIGSVIEFGCGDGNQLSLSTYPQYLGVDVSKTAVDQCRKKFAHDPSKTFITLNAYDNQKAELGLSLDVIYHLIEDHVFHSHMLQLFNSARRYVIIYSSNSDQQYAIQGKHVRHRDFGLWIEKNRPEWKLLKHIPNLYPYNPNTNSGSFADFYFYERKIN